MFKPIRILLQTTIPAIEDDWNIEQFSLLRARLASVKNDHGKSLFDVTARNRKINTAGDDPALSTLDATDFDELWLFAVDTGDGLTAADCRGITRFRERGRGIMATRDHQDLGSSLCTLGCAVAESSFHHFADYNWDITKGCPTFVTERPGEEVGTHADRLAAIKKYVRNVAVWLAP
jgi:hypothetical protein